MIVSLGSSSNLHWRKKNKNFNETTVFQCPKRTTMEPTERSLLKASPLFKVAQNSNISVRSLGSNAPFSAGNHAITRGFVR